MTRVLAGYTDRISVCPGETIAFKVSAEDGASSYRASLVRLHCLDSHRDGPGLQEEVVPCAFDGVHPARHQPIHIGSCAVVDGGPAVARLRSFSIAAMIWPTLRKDEDQVIASASGGEGGFALALDPGGRLTLSFSNGSRLTLKQPLLLREWVLVAASYDEQSGLAALHATPANTHAGYFPPEHLSGVVEAGLATGGEGTLVLAAGRDSQQRFVHHFNGKIDSPRLTDSALPVEALRRIVADPFDPERSAHVIGAWDFAQEMGRETIVDLSPNRLDGRLVNMPTRAMKGWNWSGRWQDWKHAPQEYGAIHFHDDDLSDCRWETDFTFTIPADLPSGFYAAKLESTGDPEHVVFFVRAPRGRPGAKAAFLASTATYMAYGNYRVMNRSNLYEMYLGQLPELVESDLFLNARPQYGDSLYATHNDGSGISIATRLRPIVNMRPNTTLSAFNDDGWILGWFKALGLEVDIITDEDLHNEGLALLSDYRLVITGNHPEYVSTRMWDAFQAFLDRGGRLMYLGGNGFYWRIAYHSEVPGVLELRRTEDGPRPWEAEPGEYTMSFNGEYGGLWRRAGRPPNGLIGVGFTASGFDISSYYRRTPESADPRVRFIFEGVEDEIIGNFGLAGGAAAGQEIDRYDRSLGSPPHALVVARSEDHTEEMMVAKEDMPATNYIIGGTENPLVHADMTFFETPNGGAVFSTGSITWAASLPYNGFDNNVSRVTANVFRRFVDPAPFVLPRREAVEAQAP
ncbi:N,N-dimethylformamidase beta subunit family domain-containing protein [Rhodoligotrophos defluvii]|uniref:N,N-dimethylformamidase beta subunit family domain-containing protein n=1 Tax=Rhodoligotrophos defluvii TaxID=2561934 RepID=UPI0010C97D27|nr:N,N-dimethylformamidase beta subunit family domain-containing protein [Rhodoligotrophos defluvii]